jgi:hypothetical protein
MKVCFVRWLKIEIKKFVRWLKNNKNEVLAVRSKRCLSDMFLFCFSLLNVSQFDVSTVANRVTDNGSPDLRGFGAGVAKLRSAEKSRKCADVSRSRPHLRMQSGDPMWRRMAPHRFAAWRRWRFSPQMLMRRSKL